MVHTLPGTDLAWAEIFVPVACFTAITMFQVHEFRQTGGIRIFFKKIRAGWVEQNFLTGQAAANTTSRFADTSRDYLRVTTFFGNVSVLLSTFVVGTAGTLYSNCQGNESGCSTERKLLVVKMACLAGTLLAIFFVYSQSTRYSLHFHFMMNCKFIDGRLQPYSFMIRVFQRAHMFYSVGMRLWFVTIPLFAWIFSKWFLLAVTPVHMYYVHTLESDKFMRKELDAFHRTEEEGVIPNGAEPSPPAPDAKEGKRTPRGNSGKGATGDGSGGDTAPLTSQHVV